MIFSQEQLAATLLLFFLLLCWAVFQLRHGHHWRSFGREDARELPGAVQYFYAATNWTVQSSVSVVVHLGIRPDTISWLGFAMGAITALTVATDNFAIAIFTLFISGALDVLDGQVAKQTETASPAGAALDSFLDRSVDYFYYAGALWLWREEPLLVVACLAALHGSSLVSYTTALAEKYQLALSRGVMRRADRGGILLIAILLSAFTREFEKSQELIPALPLAAGICLIALLANYAAFERLMTIRKMLKQQKDES